MCEIIKTETYVIKSNECELPRGSYFHLRPGDVKKGDLAMYAAGEKLVIGRYFPNVFGVDFILQPKRWIRCNTPIRILGQVVPVEAPPKKKKSRKERNRLPRKLAC